MEWYPETMDQTKRTKLIKVSLMTFTRSYSSWIFNEINLGLHSEPDLKSIYYLMKKKIN